MGIHLKNPPAGILWFTVTSADIAIPGEDDFEEQSDCKIITTPKRERLQARTDLDATTSSWSGDVVRCRKVEDASFLQNLDQVLDSQAGFQGLSKK